MADSNKLISLNSILSYIRNKIQYTGNKQSLTTCGWDIDTQTTVTNPTLQNDTIRTTNNTLNGITWTLIGKMTLPKKGTYLLSTSVGFSGSQTGQLCAIAVRGYGQTDTIPDSPTGHFTGDLGLYDVRTANNNHIMTFCKVTANITTTADNGIWCIWAFQNGSGALTVYPRVRWVQIT